MKFHMTRFAVLCFLVCTVMPCSAEDVVAEATSTGERDAYSKRAGAFYEKTYLVGAIKGLQAVFAPQELSEEKARKMLLDQIYGFLGQSYKERGEISRRGHAAVLARLDREVAALADDPAVLQKYEKWKEGGNSDYPNPLAFLTKVKFQAPPLHLELSEHLIRNGWMMQSLTTLDDTGTFADVLGVEPYQVFSFFQAEQGQAALQMTILVFRMRDTEKVLSQLDTLRRDPKPGRNSSPELFWRTEKHAMFSIQDFSADTSALRDSIKRQWLGNAPRRH